MLEYTKQMCVNRLLPDYPEKLAKVLGFGAAEVSASLPGVMPFFAIRSDLIVSPELEAYSHIPRIRKHACLQAEKRVQRRLVATAMEEKRGDANGVDIVTPTLSGSVIKPSQVQ